MVSSLPSSKKAALESLEHDQLRLEHLFCHNRFLLLFGASNITLNEHCGVAPLVDRILDDLDSLVGETVETDDNTLASVVFNVFTIFK